MLRTMADHGLQSMITFHHRTIEAEAFAAGVGGVAARLHAAHPGRYPARVWSGWLRGEHAADHRRQVLADFGSRDDRAILSNCRVLGEGVDIRAVDSVALLDPKGAPPDIVQAIGRSLRQTPGQGKLASLVVPIFLGPGDDPDDMTTGAYRPLVSVLQALRAHDADAVELLAIPQTGETRTNPVDTIGTAPEEGQEESRLLLRFSAPRDPAAIADLIAFNVIDTERQDWARGYAAARRYRAREGHLRVPFDHAEASARGGGRGRTRSDTGSAASARPTPQAPSARRTRGGRPNWAWSGPPRPRVAGTPRRGAGVPRRPRNPRRPAVGDVARPADRAMAHQPAPPRRPRLPSGPRRRAGRHRPRLGARVAAGLAAPPRLPRPTPRRRDHAGRHPPRRHPPRPHRRAMARPPTRPAHLGQAHRRATRTPHRARRGTGAGHRPRQPPERPHAGSERLRAGHGGTAPVPPARTGSTTVPRGHVEPIDGTDVRLGVWLSNTRSRRTKLTPEQLDQLAALGHDWR